MYKCARIHKNMLTVYFGSRFGKAAHSDSEFEFRALLLYFLINFWM